MGSFQIEQHKWSLSIPPSLRLIGPGVGQASEQCVHCGVSGNWAKSENRGPRANDFTLECGDTHSSSAGFQSGPVALYPSRVALSDTVKPQPTCPTLVTPF